MRKAISKAITLTIAVGLMLSLSLMSSVTGARPLTTVKVNGALPGLLAPDMPDTVMLEAKAKLENGVFVSGSGSVHGTTCGATFFFELQSATVGTSFLTMTGSIVSTNNGHQRFYNMWIDSEVQITASLDGSNMHFMLPEYGIDFSGSGQVII